jgi:hypothetical protein
MMPVIIDKNFDKGWTTRLSGTGNITVNNGVLKCTGTGSDQAMMDYWIPVLPGQKVEAEVMARNLNGDVRIALDLIDYRGDGYQAQTEYVKVTSPEWRRYKLSLVVPLSATQQYVRLVLGKWSSVASNHDGEYINPIIRISHGYGVGIVLARGLIRLINGVVDIHPNFTSFGISNVTFNGTDAVTVTLERPVFHSIRPIIMVSGTPDNKLIPLGGNFTGGNPSTFLIKWTNGTAIQNVSTGSYYVFVTVTM